jgi:hypothetical protein
VTVIAGQAWPVKVHAQRDQLIARIRKDGFAQTMEAVAYTWFNRFAALRYMELHDYLGHGHRALSSTSGGLPDILTHATDLTNELPGLNAAKVTELKLAGNRDGELYRMLLVAQCNALSRAMPFLFERIDDDSELLLPDNLLRSDSVIAKLVAEIPEEDWAEVEIIGWLYQFYISEKKDQVIGKVVKSEDIPAATQLFTPNWIVQYLVQNSVGRLWLMANPQSTLAKEWPYYITPAEQTPEVQAQLDALIQTRVREDGDTLNPESITVLDPACGSGHILVVAYDVLKAIYLERGYQPRAIPRLILEKNLYGLDIDDRAAQMAGFALLMKARADDRRLFTATDDAGNLQPPKLNVLSLQESKGLSVDELATHLAPFKVQRATITALVETFEHAKTFGSLIQIPYALKTHLAVLPQVLALVKQSGDMYASAAADDLLPLVQQAQVLAMQFDAVVANPPYMGGKSTLPATASKTGTLPPEVPESQITLGPRRPRKRQPTPDLLRHRLHDGPLQPRRARPDLCPRGQRRLRAWPLRHLPRRCRRHRPHHRRTLVCRRRPSRIREFLRAVWGPDTLEENMAWLAESLGTKASETPDETIRRYIADKFFKDHLQTYKKRPIYWLFSSGKQGAFQALVYLHRYHEGTLARLRAEYVVPLTGKIQSRIEMLQKDAAAASSTAARNKLAKEVEKLKKKHVELLAYDEQLRHYADMRITLDLDDGVKVNYGKFGDLLAEVKAVTVAGAGDEQSFAQRLGASVGCEGC